MNSKIHRPASQAFLSAFLLASAFFAWSCAGNGSGSDGNSITGAGGPPAIQVANLSSFAVTMSVSTAGQEVINSGVTYTFNPTASGSLTFICSTSVMQFSKTVPPYTCPGSAATVVSSPTFAGSTYFLGIYNRSNAPISLCGSGSGVTTAINWNAP
ncbi:MAG TPA: hypothetical protein VMV05_05645 [bacterium]|nr:hypothetical protein [bacterium]